MSAKEREMRLLRLTVNELESLPKNTNTYAGLGKMYEMGMPWRLDNTQMLTGHAGLSRHPCQRWLGSSRRR